MTAPSLLLDLTRRYCEPQRHYHSIRHIANMLFAGRELALTEEQTYAIWYHDAIYDPHSDTNEEDSASLARSDLRSIGWDTGPIEAVAQMVLDTKSHEPTVAGSAEVIDLDLSSIAADWQTFESNRIDIRAEYSWLSDADFNEGTTSFLAAFLAREQIFCTEWGAQFESQARANLTRSLANLA